MGRSDELSYDSRVRCRAVWMDRNNSFSTCFSSTRRLQAGFQRTGEVGCWNIAGQSIGQLKNAHTYWHLDTYTTHDAAKAAKSPQGTVVETEGKIWLLTIDDQANWHATGGEHIADIGPLPVTAGANYSVRYLDAVFEPGMTAAEHRHAGPEAWYTLAGETCLETPEGAQIGRAGGSPVIVPGGLPMHLTATGNTLRRALVLILYQSDHRRPRLQLTTGSRKGYVIGNGSERTFGAYLITTVCLQSAMRSGGVVAARELMRIPDFVEFFQKVPSAPFSTIIIMRHPLFNVA